MAKFLIEGYDAVGGWSWSNVVVSGGYESALFATEDEAAAAIDNLCETDPAAYVASELRVVEVS